MLFFWDPFIFFCLKRSLNQKFQCLKIYPLFRLLCAGRWIWLSITSNIADYIFTARTFPGIAPGMATGVPKKIFEQRTHCRLWGTEPIFLVSIAKLISMAQWFGRGAISHSPSWSPNDSFQSCKLSPPNLNKRLDRCRILFALPSSLQSVHSLDFDQWESTLSSSQLPVRKNEPPRVFRPKGEMRARRRKCPFVMPFCCQNSHSPDLEQWESTLPSP